MSAAVSKFITELALHFPPKHANAMRETAWLRSMAEALHGYSAEVLDTAARRIIDTRTYTTFPLPADCRETCEAVKREEEIVARAQTLPVMRQSAGDDWSTERLRLAYDLIKSPLGRQAASDNPCWVSSLWSFCRKNQRLPKDHEIERCKRDAREFDEHYALCVRGDAGPLSRVLEKMGASMLAKREELRTEALGRGRN